MNPLELIRLAARMERTSGNPEIVIGFIDGPVRVEVTEEFLFLVTILAPYYDHSLQVHSMASTPATGVTLAAAGVQSL